MSRKWTWSTLLVVFGLVLVACGGGGGSPRPDPPLQVEATANRTTVEVKQKVELTAEVKGTGSGSAGVVWTATKDDDAMDDDAFSSTAGRKVSWTAPDEPGMYVITATASSGNRKAEDHVTVNVVPVGDGDTYYVEGMIWTQHESPASGVEITFSDGYDSVTSDQSGHWFKDGLRGEVTVTVQESDTFKPDDTYNPTSVTVNDYEYIQFVGEVIVLVDPSYDVSGTVTHNDSPLEGVEVSIRWHDEHVVTDAAGAFAATDIGLETWLTPSKDGYIFQPAEYEVKGEEHGIEFAALTTEEATIEFVDPNLKAAMRDRLTYIIDEDEPITLAVVPFVNSLTTWDWDISDLGGLEHFVEIDYMHLGRMDNSGLDDLTPLANLDLMRILSIRNSSVSDLSPLRNKVNMTQLTLENNRITDISDLMTLPELTTLDLNDNPLADLSPFNNYTRTSPYVLSLNLSGTEVTDLQPLTSAGMGELGTLDLSDNDVLSDITPLLGTNAIRYDLRNTPNIDWCHPENSWDIVEQLKEREDVQLVSTNTPCTGPYELYGTVDVGAVSDFPSGAAFHVFIIGTEGEWLTDVDGAGEWAETVEGSVWVTPRVKAASNTDRVYRFTPETRQVARQYRDLDFVPRRVTTPIIEGWVEDGDGNPLVGGEVRLTDAATDAYVGTATINAFGYFEHTFSEHRTVNIEITATNSDTMFSTMRNVATPRQVHLHGGRLEGTIAYVHDGAIYTIDPDGENKQKVTDVVSGTNNGLAWSPDADRIVYADGVDNGRTLHIINADGTGKETLVDVPDMDVRGPSWSVDDKIVYSRKLTGGHQPIYNPWHLYVTTPSGGAGSGLVIEAHHHYMDPSWSPDGNHIAVGYSPTGEFERGPSTIVVLDEDGENPDEVEEGSFAAWAPNGWDIAYVTEDDEIMVATWPSALVPYKAADGTRPTWSPDGKLIAFEKDGNIYVVSTTGGSEPIFVTEGTYPVWSSR